MKRSLLLSFLLLASPAMSLAAPAQSIVVAQGPSLLDACAQLHQMVLAVEAKGGRSDLLADCQRLADAAASLQTFLSAGPPEYSIAELEAQKDQLELARTGLRFTAGGDPVFAPIDELAKKLRLRLGECQDAFAGHALPVRAELARTPVDVPYKLPEYDGPPQLLIDVRTVHEGIDSLWKPRGVVAYRSWAAGPWTEDEYHRLTEAAYDLELQCEGSYHNVATTRHQFDKLDKLYRRAGKAGWTTEGQSIYDRLDRAMIRLRAFYAALGPETKHQF
jgi:hypothetical protein